MSAERRRLALVAGAAAVLVGAAAVLAVVWMGRGAGGPAVVVTDRQGRQVASLPLPEAGRFSLRYVHSVYRAEVTETFAVDGPAGFRLVEVASPSEAVLDYYELEGPRRTEAGWRHLTPAHSPRVEALPLVATEVGRRTLVVGDRHLPLWPENGPPTHLVLTVRG